MQHVYGMFAKYVCAVCSTVHIYLNVWYFAIIVLCPGVPFKNHIYPTLINERSSQFNNVSTFHKNNGIEVQLILANLPPFSDLIVEKFLQGFSATPYYRTDGILCETPWCCLIQFNLNINRCIPVPNSPNSQMKNLHGKFRRTLCDRMRFYSFFCCNEKKLQWKKKLQTLDFFYFTNKRSIQLRLYCFTCKFSQLVIAYNL